MEEQLAFDLPARVALGPGDYLVSEANRDAHDLAMTPARWPGGRLALVGPAGSGKSHLARLVAARTGAAVLDAAAAGPGTPLPDGRAVVLEDVERLAPGAEEWLFHLYNRLTNGGLLLLTAATPPARWPVALPDLASRLQSVAVVTVADPDDRLLAAVLMKHFDDRQLVPAPPVLPYLLGRMDRSFAAAAEIVAEIDRRALAAGRRITRDLAREALEGRDGRP